MDVTNLDEKTKRELARYLYLQNKLREQRAIDFWKPWVCKHDGKHTSQFEAFQSTARRRLVCGGNRPLAYGTRVKIFTDFRLKDSYVNIEDLRVGDTIVGWNGRWRVPVKVIDIPFDGEADCVKYVLKNHKFVIASKDHYFPVYLDKGHHKPKQFKCNWYDLKDKSYARMVLGRVPVDNHCAQILRMTEVGKKRVRCITVDHPKHQFVLSNDIVTYNSGKTMFGAADVAHHFLGTHPYRTNRVPMIIKVLGEDYPNHINNVIIPKLKAMIPKSAIKSTHKNHGGVVSKIVGYNGSIIDLMCYEQGVEKFESFDADMAWFDEPPPEAIYQGVVRGLLDREGYELFTMTPIKEPWIFNELWMPGLEKKLSNTDAFIMMTECNPYLKQTAIDQLKEIYTDPDIREARLKGNFLHLSGRVYKMFQKDKHVVPMFEWPREWPVWMCIDPHPKKPHAVTWIGVTNKDQKVIIDEIKADCTIKDLAKLILQKEAKMKYKVVDRLVDTSIKGLERTDQRRLLADYGIRCRFPKKYDDVFPGIQRVQQALTPSKDKEAEFIELVVRENCLGHINEFLSYVWSDGTGNKPNKENDDYMDNIRYITGVNPKFAYRPQYINYAGDYQTYGQI